MDPPQLPEERCVAQGAELLPKLLLLQPLTRDAPLDGRPGGGPRDFGAPHNSEVTAVAGLRSPRALDVGSLLCGLQNTLISQIQFKNCTPASGNFVNVHSSPGESTRSRRRRIEAPRRRAQTQSDTLSSRGTLARIDAKQFRVFDGGDRQR